MDVFILFLVVILQLVCGGELVRSIVAIPHQQGMEVFRVPGLTFCDVHLVLGRNWPKVGQEH